MPPRLPVAASLDAAATSLTVQCPRRAAFSTTSRRDRVTKGRFDMYTWLNNVADRTFESGRRGASYLGPFTDQPFPSNPLFRSQPVLSEPMRDIIYKKVMEEGNALKAVSEEMGVDVRRVAAVVRLKQVEKRWISDGKKLATPYAKAVMDMLPQSRYFEGEENNTPHEPINDIPVHKLSVQQLFVPVSESRHFTREDAAKAFHETLLSADTRSPHRQLIKMEREVATAEAAAAAAASSGKGGKQQQKIVVDRAESLAKFRKEAQEHEEKFAQKLAEEKKREALNTRRARTDRFEFRVKMINTDDVGHDGRSRRGVGWRYGAPLQDRKRGQVKIPTSVP